VTRLAHDGPRVVGMGGGHGLAASLRAARRYAGELTAIVSVADDGGSSGRLRQALGIPAPGDLRRCLVALSGDEGAAALWARAFEHRFDAGELSGHALGNLVIAGLAAATGDFAEALDEASRLLGTVGRVLPATVDPVALKGVAGGREVEGQVAVDNAGAVSHLSIVPGDARPPDAALEALARADQIVLGPGSLFTSVLAVVAVPALREAVAASPGQRVYVANLRAGVETPGWDVAAHVAALEGHGVRPDVVVADPSFISLGNVTVPLLTSRVAGPDGFAHDPERLAETLRAALDGAV
jgi:uncharacterized cofD-like protein